MCAWGTGLQRPGPHARPRPGFTLAEALVALVILAFTALATASAEGWAARTTAAAEAREDAAAAAELIADSLAFVRVPTRGSVIVDGLQVGWEVAGAASAGAVTVRLRVRPLGRPLARGRAEEEYGVVLAPPLRSLEDEP